MARNYTLGEDAFLIIEVNAIMPELLFYDNTPSVVLDDKIIKLGVCIGDNMPENRVNICMNMEQAKAIRKGLKMQIKKLKGKE